MGFRLDIHVSVKHPEIFHNRVGSTVVCTIVVAWQVFEEAPIAVAANRDERLDRPFEAPDRIATEPAIVAPRDEKAGGTWIGYNEHNVLAAVTNRWTDENFDGDRSRGLLTLDALRTESAKSAAEIVERTLAKEEYDTFNLLLCDPDSAILLEWDGYLKVHPFDPGVHVIMNVGFDETFDIPSRRLNAGTRQMDNAWTIRATLQPISGESVAEWLNRAGVVLGNHEFGVCVHGNGFGTRSSTLLAIRENGPATYRFADGPPCRTQYLPVETQI